jgi:hypothetical protein
MLNLLINLHPNINQFNLKIMKKVLFALLAVTVLVASSCSKERKINKRLDGTWSATTLDNEALTSTESVDFTFTKDENDNGTGSMSIKDGEFSFAATFSYTLVEDKLDMIVDFFGEKDTLMYTVTKYDKTDLELTDRETSKKSTFTKK